MWKSKRKLQRLNIKKLTIEFIILMLYLLVLTNVLKSFLRISTTQA